LRSEVFGRLPGYDSKQDPIVRTEARRLRARLSEYYLADGKGDSMIIDLPKGFYVPVLRQAVAEGSTAPPHRLTRALPIAAAAACVVVALIAVGGWWFYKNVPTPIAVLPLNNLSEDSAHDYFADGLTGEISRNLSIIDGLAVRSQTSSFAFKGKPQHVREAGKQLGADYIVEGSVQRAGQQLRITGQLIRVRDDFRLWSGRYDRELTDVFAIQDEISRGIVNSLRLKLGGRRRYDTSAEADDLYLQARALEIQRGLEGDNRSVAPFEAAIAKDPSFARHMPVSPQLMWPALEKVDLVLPMRLQRCKPRRRGRLNWIHSWARRTGRSEWPMLARLNGSSRRRASAAPSNSLQTIRLSTTILPAGFPRQEHFAGTSPSRSRKNPGGYQDLGRPC
jgi:TolB-like protein